MLMLALALATEKKNEALQSPVAGLGTDDQKSAAHATTPIATAFKTCVSHRKMGS
jgi:hypothetical protein